ncbi:MAG TPA: AMP-binding protein [Acidimicrobiales bacterium]|nr:AMP-binding protein [Acidimicrobiales bacterium]
MTNWNFADVWGVVAETFPDRPAVAQGDVRLTWRDFDRRAESVASALLDAGLGPQAKVAQYLYNCPAYLESVFACFKAGLVPVNTNYRYTDDELVYLWDNSDTEAIIFHGSFAERVERIRDRLPGVKVWLWLADGDHTTCPGWAVAYETVAAGAPPAPGKNRSGDDMLFIYTGGTTGMPKGVMWRQDDLFAVLNRTGEVRYPEDGTLDDVRETLRRPSRYPAAKLLPGPPLMHGTGLFTAMSVLSSAGSVVMPLSRHLDVVALLDLIQAERITEMSLVGDAFAKPILAALDAEPDRWDISSLWLIISSGVMWSAEVKAGLLRHNPKLILADTLGSSEAVGMARSTSRAGSTSETAGFVLGDDTKVLTDDGREVTPGSGEQGRLALRGRGPMGYYKDAEKTASTFLVIDGQRWTVPGDFATIRADGSIQLLGRGSVCINTGGEKVFPEEVEEVLKRHPAVADAVVVGVPDDRFGETVTAVVEAAPGGTRPDDAELIDWVKGHLAAYKAPRHVVGVDTIGRSPSGKVDYRRLRQHAIDSVTSPA